MITRLDHVQLAMPNGEEAKARAFFGSLLKMNEEEKPELLASRGGCWFRSGSVLLHLGVEKDFIPQKKAHPAYSVRDIDLAAKQLMASGYPVIWDDALPSRRRFYTADPFGNRIELMRDGDGFGQK
jgi:catechol 2,3-dioxygenase-like lactoylglutathione lyase family enzyme